MDRSKVIEDFLNSLESEQLQQGQDAMLLSASTEDQYGASLNTRCHNNSSACVGSSNDKVCFNEKPNCTGETNFRRCKSRKPRWKRRN